ncbi:MAG: 4Fe-4S binding protein [Actinomycetota bacterium]
MDMSDCIRCGNCHTACPENAVRHDSEKAPERVETNLKEVKEFMVACEEKLGDESERLKCLKRMLKHYNNEKRIAEETLEKLNSLKARLNSAKNIK